MSAKLKILCAFAIGIAAGVTAGCQTYDFEPVQPLAIAQTTQTKVISARNSKPNLMLLVDKSGSMALPTVIGGAGCPANCGTNPGPGGNACPSSCPTRISEMRKAMNTFLTNSGTVARMGMTAFPIDTTCGGPTAVQIELSQSNDVDAELTAKASEINTAIQAILDTNPGGTPTAVGGGTPTGSSIREMGNYAGLQDPTRDNFVLVLTDGLPNCNEANANNCTNATACQCTLSGNCGTDTTAQFCTKGCLDQSGAVAEITNLRAKNIKTIVVGFGADLATGTAPSVLNAMAVAGGFALSCPGLTDAECGVGNTCNTANKTCAQKFYQAKNSDDLAAALAKIGEAIKAEDICKYKLDAAPSNPQFLSVLIDGAPAPKDQWSYDGTYVLFTGAICDRLKASTSINKVKVEFRIVQGL